MAFVFGDKIPLSRVALVGYCWELDPAEFSNQSRPLSFLASQLCLFYVPHASHALTQIASLGCSQIKLQRGSRCKTYTVRRVIRTDGIIENVGIGSYDLGNGVELADCLIAMADAIRALE